MTEPSDDRYPDGEHLRRYVLGDLSEDEAAAIETAYFADPTLLARVEIAEHDVLDEYAGNRMSFADRGKLERTLLATRDGRTELALARSLRTARQVEASPAGSARSVGRVPRRQWLAAAAVVAITVGGLSMVWWLGNDRERPSQTTAVPSSPPPPAAAPPATSPIVVATLVLRRDLSRSEGSAPTLIASPETTHVDLTVPDVLPNAGVRARIETVERRAVWSGPIDPAADGRSRVRVPASVVGLGDYVLVIVGQDGPPSNGSLAYYFRVRPR